MKINGYKEDYHLNLAGGTSLIASSIAYGHTSLGSNTPLVESGAGAPGTGPQASAWDHVHPAAGGASSAFGSNSNRVSSVSAAGASSSNSRADHVHDGIGGATASSSNSLNRGNLNLRAGTGIALALSNTDGGTGFDTVTIQNVASSSGGGGSPGASGALVLLEQHTASASATLDFTTFISSTYDEYEIHFVGIVPATNSVSFQMRMGTGAGPTWDTGANYSYGMLYSGVGDTPTQSSGTSQSAIDLAHSISTTSNASTNGVIRLFRPQAAAFKYIEGKVQSVAVGNLYQWGNSGGYNSTTALTGIRFLMSSGNIASGTILIYGVSKT